MMAAPPADSKRLTCPVCQRFLCQTDGSYVDCPACKFCGAQTTIRLDRVKPRAVILPSGPIEVKQTS